MAEFGSNVVSAVVIIAGLAVLVSIVVRAIRNISHRTSYNDRKEMP